MLQECLAKRRASAVRCLEPRGHKQCERNDRGLRMLDYKPYHIIPDPIQLVPEERKLVSMELLELSTIPGHVN